MNLIISGNPASLGVVTGRVRVLHDLRNAGEVEEGEILVTRMTNPDLVPTMRRVVAIITDMGGRTCHAAIVSRELGIPCIVGTEIATQVLKTGQVVTVNGGEGNVYGD